MLNPIVKPLLLTMLLFTAANTAQALDLSLDESKVIAAENPPPNQLTTMPDSMQAKGRGDRCIELGNEIEQLKGKPQRRHAAMERYRLECENR